MNSAADELGYCLAHGRCGMPMSLAALRELGAERIARILACAIVTGQLVGVYAGLLLLVTYVLTFKRFCATGPRPGGSYPTATQCTDDGRSGVLSGRSRAPTGAARQQALPRLSNWIASSPLRDHRTGLPFPGRVHRVRGRTRRDTRLRSTRLRYHPANGEMSDSSARISMHKAEYSLTLSRPLLTIAVEFSNVLIGNQIAEHLLLAAMTSIRVRRAQIIHSAGEPPCDKSLAIYEHIESPRDKYIIDLLRPPGPD